MAVHNTPWKIATPKLQADISTTANVIAAVSGRTLSIKSLTISNIAAALVTIEDSAGTDVISFALPARGGVARDWDPGEVPFTASLGANVLSSTSDAVTVYMTCWYKDA